MEAVAFDRPHVGASRRFAYAFGALSEIVPALAFAGVAIVAIRVLGPPLPGLIAEALRRIRFERSAPSFGKRTPDAVFERLRNEPPHVAAAVIAGLDAPLATAVLDLYEPAERRAIVSRLTRRRSPLVAGINVETLFG